MTGLLLATLLNLSPGIQLADNVESRTVVLSEGKFKPVLFQDEGLRPSLDTMTREQLANELRRLDATRPSLVGPIVMLSVGMVLAIPGAYLLATNFSAASGNCCFNDRGEATIAAGFAVTILVTGVILAGVGAALLPLRFNKANDNASEREAIQARIMTMDQQPGPPPPPPGPDEMLLPPPPPPPPQTLLQGANGMLTVAIF